MPAKPFPVLALAIFASVFLSTAFAAAAERPPNILLIMADDLGVEALSCYGSEDHETPHLDALAASGMRFDHAHAQPICTPSRVQIMTGIHNHRNYLRFGVLDPEAVTFAQVLRERGYRTVIAGKWQLGGGMEAPGHFGFERFCLWQLTRRPSRYPNPGLEIDGEEKDFKNGEFGSDLITDYLCEFFEEMKGGDAPFFAYYPMNLPHFPFVPTPDHPDWDPTMWRDAEVEPGGYLSQKYWAAFVRYTDKMVGKLVDKLEETGQRENTLVIWTADNGTYRGFTTRFRGGTWTGAKGSPTDAGTHVGFIASWPAVIELGQASDSLVDFTDVFPTLLEVSGTEGPEGLELDGVSLVPAFRGEERAKEAIYCWYHRDGVREEASQHARDQHHKLYGDGRFYDLTADPEEKRDLAEGGVPPEFAEAHARLLAVLEREMAVAAAADAEQAEKSERYASRALVVRREGGGGKGKKGGKGKGGG